MMKTVVFDLDGTLVDSVPDLAAALNRLLVTRNLSGFDEAEVQAMVGDGALALLERAFTARRVAMDAGALAEFLNDYTSHAAVLTRPYPGVIETLEALRAAGCTLAVCTNKPAAAAGVVLQTLGLAKFFNTVSGGDTFAVRKPNPEHLRATLRAVGGVAEQAVMVGDHHNDVEAARGAGMRSIWVTWGYGRDVRGADGVVERFSDIPGLLARWG